MRKITFALFILLTISLSGQERRRSVGSGTAVSGEAALAPIAVPGTTVSGTVTAVNGTTSVVVANVVKIDITNAKILDDRSANGSAASITVGSRIFAILSDTTPTANGLPAASVVVQHFADLELTGPAVITNGVLTVLGQTITVNSNTSFGGRAKSLADILPNDIVTVQANVVGGTIVATSIMVATPRPLPSTIIHGTVKTIGPDSWVITDSAGKDWTVVVNSQTKIIGSPKVGDTVEILANKDSANQYVALSISQAPLVLPLVSFSGEVKSIGAAQWVIHDSRANKDITVAITAKTVITGSPQVNDGVMVAATVDSAGNYTAVSIIKLGIVPNRMTISGVVKVIEQLPVACAALQCITAYWTVGPAVGLGPDFRVGVNGFTKISGDPKVGDRVTVTAEMTSTGLIAISIVK